MSVGNIFVVFKGALLLFLDSSFLLFLFETPEAAELFVFLLLEQELSFSVESEFPVVSTFEFCTQST